MTHPMEYRLAADSPSLLSSYVLEDERLVIVDVASGRRDELPFSEIRAIQLRQTLGAYVAHVSRRTGKTITIRSRYVGAGGLEDRVAEYAELVTKLHDASRKKNPAVLFLGGSTELYWLGWLLVALGALFVAILGWAVLVRGEAPPRGLFAVVPLGLIAGTACVRQGRATPYDPSAPPERLLPRSRAA
jgi:hypothetical protein